METPMVEVHGLYRRGRGKVHFSPSLLCDCLVVLVFPGLVRQRACSDTSLSFLKA